MRIHELAKELGIESKELVAYLAENGLEVKAASSAKEDAIALANKKYGKKKAASSASETEEKKAKNAPKEEKAEKSEKKEKTSGSAEEKAPAKAKPAAKAESAKAAEAPVKKAPEEVKAADGTTEKKPAGDPAKRPVRLGPDGKPLRPKKKTTFAVFNPQNTKNGADRPGYRPQGGMDPRRGGMGRPGERPVSRRLNGERPVSKRLMESERQDRERADAERAAAAAAAQQRESADRPVREARPAGERVRRPVGADRGTGAPVRRAPGEQNRFVRTNPAAAQQGPSGDNRNAKDGGRGRGNQKGNNNRRDNDRLGGKRQENFFNLEKRSNRKKPQPQPQKKEDEDTIKSITLPEHLTIKELSDRMKVQASVLIKKLFLKGQMVTMNQEVDYETAEEIALEFNFIAEQEEKVDVIAELLKEEEEDESRMVARPPVVCVMGHVDHGKTSLLDAIRDTHVTDREAGGITQKIGAYVVSINGRKITFLDTPGHEAFTAMRMRGAKSTDIAILVVAADDGVMPQTVEAINHARAAGIEIIVAINKIDKPNANIDRVKQELSEYELIPEDWGGSTVFAPVSAHTHEGIDNLLEMVLLTADVLELKANPKRNARGVVVEAQLDKGRGAVATVLVQKGTLKVGQPVACGSAYGKVRAMIDEKGRRLKEAGPSTPVEILGLNNVPDAGETFVVCDSEKDAHNFAQTYISQDKEKLLEETRARMSLDDLFSQIQAGNVKELDIIVKADVQGSVEAVKQSLEKLSNDEVVVKVIHGGVGAINESDVILASASSAIIIGFNVRPDPQAKSTAETEGVDIRLYKVIYNAIEDVEAAMKGMLDPVFEEKVIGHAEIRQIFKASGIGNIAGSYVLDGVFERGCKCRITREGEQIFDGELASLKRFKDDVKEVKAGFECGLVFEGFNDIAELDQVEAYKMVEVAR